MDGRERFLTALSNKKPDRLPFQVHGWMRYYLDSYLNGMDQYEAYEYFGMDPVIYVSPVYIFDDKDMNNWRVEFFDGGADAEGVKRQYKRITTPKGILESRYAENEFTLWETEHLVKNERDMELFLEYYPVPVKTDWTPVKEAKKRVGGRGIVRGDLYNHRQGGGWQSVVELMGTQDAIFKAMDEPGYIHRVIEIITQKRLAAIDAMGKIEFDLIENGGGAGSSTVISPAMHREFCLPYEKRVHAALKAAGTKVVYHLCGGVMPVLEAVAENGADALETMTPPSMGGDCDMAQAAKRVGDKLCFTGGFDQNAGFENGTERNIEEQVFALFKSKPGGGFICSPSDHFFFGDPKNIKHFTEICKSCRY